MTDPQRAHTNEHVADEGARPRGIAGEIGSTNGLARRGLDTSERELMLVDRIIVLENKLAELQHRYKMSTEGGYATPPALPEPPQRLRRTRDVYALLLRVPGVGWVARRGVAVAKKARAAGRDG